MDFCLDRRRQMERIGIHDAHGRLSGLVDRVESGEEVLQTRTAGQWCGSCLPIEECRR